jgi:hypothetical protein
MMRPSAAYLPILALPYWDVIGVFVDDAVAACLPHTERSDRDLYAAAVPMVLWCWQARGTPLEWPRIFRKSMIEQFIHLGMPGAARGSQATLRSTLWRMAEILNPAQADAIHRPIARSAPTRPYSSADIAELTSWADTQGTVGRRRDARTMLALGLGAGLAARELLEAQTTDVIIDAQSTRSLQVVVWRERTRLIPVHPAWASQLERTVTEVPAGGWLFRPGRQSATPGQITDFLTRSRSPLDVRPVRMRATWLVQHLLDGTPAEDILRISGLKNYAALDRLIPFTRKLTKEF